jgi:4-diphosphocytidyl-2-C-methyl-D-erythritol kinase
LTASAATVRAPAKINLTLEVLGRRDDGFHDIRSLVIGVGLADRLHGRILPAPGIELHCADPTLGNDRNLVYQALVKLGEHCRRAPDFRIQLEKSIPVAAGLGGGSSDAAAMLSLANHLWETGLDSRELAAIGATLGSDVPLFFSLPAAVITGRGEEVEPVRLRWSGWVLLVFAGGVVATPEVYRAWRREDAAKLPTAMDQRIIEAQTAAEMTPMLSNHLEPATFRVAPQVARLHTTLDRLGHGAWRVSGAGSTLYQLFDEREAANSAAQEIERIASGITTAVVEAPVGPSPIVNEGT